MTSGPDFRKTLPNPEREGPVPKLSSTVTFTSSPPRVSFSLFSFTTEIWLKLGTSDPVSQVVCTENLKVPAMAGKAAKSIVKAVGEFQYPWKEKLAKYKDELSKGVWGYWELGAWKPLGISARRRARLRNEVLLAGQDWPFDPARKEMRTKRKGHKVDRIAAEKRANTAELMKKMPEMLLDYKKRRWAKKMKEEEAKAAKD